MECKDTKKTLETQIVFLVPTLKKHKKKTPLIRNDVKKGKRLKKPSTYFFSETGAMAPSCTFQRTLGATSMIAY